MILRAALVLAFLAAPGLRAFAAEVATVTRIVYPGQTVDANAVRVVSVKPDFGQGRRLARNAADLAGMVARRTLLPGRAIELDALRQRNAVEAGALVQVFFRSGTLEIAMSATALSAAAAGEAVRVRNEASGRIFTGTAAADGSVVVGTAR